MQRLKDDPDYWIGLHRDNLTVPWRWPDNSTYVNISGVNIRGSENHAYIHKNGASSARVYVDKRWICWKPVAASWFLPS